MFEESAALPSIWESMHSWFTPAVLFVLLNVMIGTILFTSNLANHNHQDHKPQNEPQQQHQQQQPKLTRSPSVLQRIKSINFYPYRSQESSSPAHFKQNQDFSLDQTLETAATQYVFNQVLEHQPPNSLTHFALNQNHHHETPNSLTHFALNQNHHHETPNSLAHFPFDQTNHHETPNTNTHFTSAQTHYQENPDINTHFVFPHQETQITNTHFVFEQTHNLETKETDTQFVFDQTPVEKSPNEDAEELQSLDEVYSQLTERHVSRTTSDTKPASGEIPKRLPEKIKKSASMKSAFSHFEEEKIVEARRPATVRERKAKISEEDDGEVDAKADDFINKFKHQLKLQRIDSIIRYKDVISRGNAK